LTSSAGRVRVKPGHRNRDEAIGINDRSQLKQTKGIPENPADTMIYEMPGVGKLSLINDLALTGN
jgi:hypothetical protein